jgi:uncharacterized membrane protein YphA (DoxX/SURF4 family)
MLVARLGLGGVYLWYGWNKVAEPVAFLKALRAYEMLPLDPPQWLNLTAVVLPWLEVVCALCVLAGLWLRAAGGILLAMTAAFTVAVTVRAIDLAAVSGEGLCAVVFDCGCGVGEVRYCAKLAENLGLLLLASVVATSRARALALARPRP